MTGSDGYKKLLEGIRLKITKVNKTFFFVLLVFIVIGLFIMLLSNKSSHTNSWDLDSWREFEKEIKQDYGYVKKILIYRNTPTVSVNLISDSELDLEETKNVFNKIREFLLTAEVFPKLDEYHGKRRGGDTIGIKITFKYSIGNDLYYYSFSSRTEKVPAEYNSFKTWYIRGNDLKERVFDEYIIE